MAGQAAYSYFNNAAAGTVDKQIISAGQYMLTATATFGSVQVFIKDTFGNFILYGAAITAPTCALIQLPQGTVRIVATGGSAYYIALAPVPTQTTR